VRADLRVAVVGGGWAGLAAAVEAAQRGHGVTLFEMAPQFGGRARAVAWNDIGLDNGQHILIGAYAETLRLMQVVGVDTARALLRMPLRIGYPDGSGLHLRSGPPALAFTLAVLRQSAWRWRDRLALLGAAAGWARRGFACDPSLTVAELAAGVPAAVRAEFLDPLCVAALNTPAAEASASVFLRVLHDALLSGPGSADLLLPRVDLSALFPTSAAHWLQAAGARLRPAHRVGHLQPRGNGWQVDDEPFDHVVLATPPREAAQLVQELAPTWADQARGLRFEPIVTVYLRAAGAALPLPMLALRDDARHPAQFVFDRGRLGGPDGLLAFVISGAQAWVERGAEVTVAATLAQAAAALGRFAGGPFEPVKAITEKRATYRCTPGLVRPAQGILPGLHAAGDYVAGPYPATLEGAVRSGVAAARAFTGAQTAPPAARR